MLSQRLSVPGILGQSTAVRELRPQLQHALVSNNAEKPDHPRSVIAANGTRPGAGIRDLGVRRECLAARKSELAPSTSGT